MSSCSEAFITLRPCAIIVVGVTGSMPVHGIGTAMFRVLFGDSEVILTVFNCLLCHGEDEGFNLLSVSQMLRTKTNSITFCEGNSGIQIKKDGLEHRIPLKEIDGLYELSGSPISVKDKQNLAVFNLTLEDDPCLFEEDRVLTNMMKSPSRLGTWTRKVLWLGARSISTIEYDDNLKEFCNTYLSLPISSTQTRKTYQVQDVTDMKDLSIRYMGVGNDRLVKTLERSRGLTTGKKDGRTTKIPPHNFPQGRWSAGKTPRVSKNKVENLHRASIAEVCFTDTFEVDDPRYRYGQAFVCYRTRYGDVIPIRSRTKVGWSFGEFCCRHFVPKILVRDNIAENIGGELAKECHVRGVKSAFICPHTPEQDQAEGYLGRVTTMASFAMVYAGAPIFMWIWCIQCAVFINNITATYYSRERVWAIPFELMHGEPYPDSSVVVPFGCAALVLLNKKQRKKFKPKCAMLIFIHYAMQHPLYTYALYSPKTKKILFRQDVIFLTNVFPMREARTKSGLEPEGEGLLVYRSKKGERDVGEEDLSFDDWKDSDELPLYEDHVSGFELECPSEEFDDDTPAKDSSWPTYQPSHPSFGIPSCVRIPVPGEIISSKKKTMEETQAIVEEKLVNRESVPGETENKSSKDDDGVSDVTKRQTTRRPVNERWFYEPVSESMMPSANDQEFPDVSGPFQQLTPDDLKGIEDNENGACALHGTLFLDEDLGWCMVSGWGVECGLPIVYYSPISSTNTVKPPDSTSEEHHASVREVLSWINNSPTPPQHSTYKSSRDLRHAKRENIKKTLLARVKSFGQRIVPMYGIMSKREGLRGIHTAKSLATRTIRRILKMQESLFKYGTYVPRNDKEAEASPEAVRWKSGRQLEWIRLKTARTFETDWTWEKIQRKFPEYKKSDIGTMFYVYDYKFSGEHRVRLVFNGAKQSPSTYTDTYAPTVRAESVRLFHIYSVEYGFSINQFDVPQAFLRSDADCDIFVYPPRGNLEYPGQILKLSKMLYGTKQAAALWFNLLDTFLKKLGFISSYFDPCLYRRPISDNCHDPDLAQCDALVILHVDDMRVAASPDILKDIHDKLYAEFQITTSDTGRLLGMDTDYNLETGVLKMHMGTYIEATMERFQNFDTTMGVPFREIVGSLLWIVLNIIGPELLRVKDLARRSNDFTATDYGDALKVLKRIYERRNCGIIYRRGGAGKEYVPSSSRPEGGLKDSSDEPEEYISACLPWEYDPVLRDFPNNTHSHGPNSQAFVFLTCSKDVGYSIGDEAEFNELDEKNLYRLNPLVDDLSVDLLKVLAPTNNRFTKVAYSDASFAVGITKQSVTGFVIMINGIPLLFGSLKQTVVVDSTCSAEYVAASVCCKQIMEIENMVQFLGFTCPRPYKMYTDSQACLKIATSNTTLGKVRHLEIRYHLVRCIIISGSIKMEYCITEEMLADLFTKIVDGSQDKRLAVRFYNDCVEIVTEGSN
jgi:hypothetical protein